MFCIKLSRGFELSSQGGDFLFRLGRREWYYESGEGWKHEIVK